LVPAAVRADPGTVTIDGVAQYVPRNGDGRPATMACADMVATAFVPGPAGSMVPFSVGPIGDDLDRNAAACRFRITGLPARVRLFSSVAYGYRNGAEGRWGPFAPGTTYKATVIVHQAPPCTTQPGSCS
jgi:hypothetical protein